MHSKFLAPFMFELILKNYHFLRKIIQILQKKRKVHLLYPKLCNQLFGGTRKTLPNKADILFMCVCVCVGGGGGGGLELWAKVGVVYIVLYRMN